MNIDELRKGKEQLQYRRVGGRAQILHVRAANDAGITESAIIESAFKEVYELLQKRGLLQSIGQNGQVHEKIIKEVRGEYIPRNKEKKDLILEYVKKHPGQELKDMHPKLGMPPGTIWSILNRFVIEGVIEKRDKAYFFSDEIADLVPKGTMMEFMR